jgi:hypothetical protein
VPTAAELQLVITAQDQASSRLRELGTEVQRLQQRVEATGSGFGTGLATRVSGVADAFRLIGAAAGAAGDVIGGVIDQLRQGFASNQELQRATVAFQRYTGSAQEAAAVIAVLRREAAVSPFNDQEIIGAGRALISYARGSTDQLLELVRVAEQLAVLDPFQGITGGVVALQEAMSGSFESLVQRFEIPRSLIERLRQEGVPNLEIVKRALEFRGIDAGAIAAYGRSVEGLLSTIQSFGQELRQIATSRLFDALGEQFAHVVALIDRYGEQLRAIAAGIAEVFVRLATAAAQALAPLLGILDQLLPGFREFATAEWGRPIEQAADATRKATPVVQELARTLSLEEARQGLAAAGGDLARLEGVGRSASVQMAGINRELGEIGVRAAEIQLGADRIRQGFEAQLRPLERQLELLQNSTEAQRLQQALASNRAMSERLGLTREIQALERAAGGAEDPEAAGLTPRQQAIALALQERRLRLEALNDDRQRAPAIQTLQERIADLRRREADALQPSQDLLASYQDRVAVLQIEGQRWQNMRGYIDDATAAIKAQQDQIASGPSEASHQQAVADAKKRGQEVADAWTTAYEKWVEDNGGTLWGALVTTFQKWWDGGGDAEVKRLGKQIGSTLWDAVLAAIRAGPTLQDVLKEMVGEAIRTTLFPGGTPKVGGTFDPTAGTGIRAGGPGSLPRVEPTVPPTPVAAAPVTVNVGGVAVQVGPDTSRDALVDDLTQTLGRQTATAVVDAMIAAQQGTDAGPTRAVQGAGR